MGDQFRLLRPSADCDGDYLAGGVGFGLLSHLIVRHGFAKKIQRNCSNVSNLFYLSKKEQTKKIFKQRVNELYVKELKAEMESQMARMEMDAKFRQLQEKYDMERNADQMEMNAKLRQLKCELSALR